MYPCFGRDCIIDIADKYISVRNNEVYSIKPSVNNVSSSWRAYNSKTIMAQQVLCLKGHDDNSESSWETQVKVDGPGRRRPKQDEDYRLEGEGRGQTRVE